MDTTPLLREGEDIIDLNEDIYDFFDAFDNAGLSVASNIQYETRFMSGTVGPMVRAWLNRKTPAAKEYAQHIDGKDWRMSMLIWLQKNFGGAV